jgi:hypothetical protein
MILQSIQSGNSLVVVPKNVLKEKNIKVGGKVHIEIKSLKKAVRALMLNL